MYIHARVIISHCLNVREKTLKRLSRDTLRKPRPRIMTRRGSREKRLAATVGRCYLLRLERLLCMSNVSFHFHAWRALCGATSRRIQRKLNVVSYRVAVNRAFQQGARLYFAEWRDSCFVRLRRAPPPPGLTHRS